MTTQPKMIIAVLAGTVAVLALLFAVAAVDAWGDGDMHEDDDGDAYMGMMGAMGDMDADGMTGQMQGMMGDGMWSQIQEHMADHESMPMASGMRIDGMMHQMMDSMMDHMMSGRGGNHHGMATPGAN